MKHHQKHGDRYSRSDDWLPDFETESDDTEYAWRSQVRVPWRKRWLYDHAFGHRSRDNEGWDADRINEMRRVRKPYGRTRRDRRRFCDDENE